ncbi:MAG: SDR family oxidoreductase [bacterium]
MNLAKSLAPNIFVNAIAPGKTLTPQRGEMTAQEEASYASTQLINRFITPEEIADSAIYLMKNDGICGEILVIDGGMSLKVLG